MKVSVEVRRARRAQKIRMWLPSTEIADTACHACCTGVAAWCLERRRGLFDPRGLPGTRDERAFLNTGKEVMRCASLVPVAYPIAAAESRLPLAKARSDSIPA